MNLFNNQWTTNFRFWNEGTWTSRIRIWMFDRYDPWTSLIKPSLEARYPLQAAVADGPAGSLPLSASGAAVKTDTASFSTNTAGTVRAGGGSTLITAFGPNPDGPGTLLRLWETGGKAGARYVRLPAGMRVKSVQPVNLRGVPRGTPIPVNDGTFELNLHAFAPFSCLLNEA